MKIKDGTKCWWVKSKEQWNLFSTSTCTICLWNVFFISIKYRNQSLATNFQSYLKVLLIFAVEELFSRQAFLDFHRKRSGKLFHDPYAIASRMKTTATVHWNRHFSTTVRLCFLSQLKSHMSAYPDMAHNVRDLENNQKVAENASIAICSDPFT